MFEQSINNYLNYSVCFDTDFRSTSRNCITFVPENVVSACMRCRDTFRLKNPRHHCRNCGHVVCNACSSKTIPLPEVGHAEAVRVCDACHTIIWQSGSQLLDLPKSYDE